MRPTPLAGLLVLGSLAAQTYSVSPVEFTNLRGPVSSSVPRSYPAGRYQQTHGDMTGSPKLLQAMTFRRAQSSAAGRAIVLTINLGDSSNAARSSTFAATSAEPP